jgi:diguanylate cyclase (GGDEF)-like protein
MSAVLTKRLNQSTNDKASATSNRCLLVRIYPMDAIEKPVELSQEPWLIGRDEHCSLAIKEDSVSRRHALLEFDGQSHVILDLGSTNGTFVNENRVNSARPLESGDRIRFGNHIYKYLTSDRIEMQYHEVMFSMMTTDGLTSVYNKRYFLETLERELAQSHRAGSPLCLIMMDLDKFKSINDTHGHLAGDAILVEFARRTKSVLRSGDLLARYGGEEFAMVLTRTSLAEAITVAERVRQTVAATPMIYETESILTTVSLGVSCFEGSSTPKPSELIAHADELLYAAKHAGRNQAISALWKSES